MYLTRGQPVVYYGDEQGFAGTGGDKDARQSMFATQTAEYANQPLVTGEQLGSTDRFDTAAPLYTQIAELSALRSSHTALRTGAQIERYADDGPGVYAFSRVDRDEKIEYLVATNNSASEKTVQIPTLTADATFTPLYGASASVASGADGAASVTVPALSAVVFTADRTVSAPAEAGPITVTAPTAGAGLSGLPRSARTSPTRRGRRRASRGGSSGDADWTPLGTAEDTSPPASTTTSVAWLPAP